MLSGSQLCSIQTRQAGLAWHLPLSYTVPTRSSCSHTLRSNPAAWPDELRHPKFQNHPPWWPCHTHAACTDSEPWQTGSLSHSCMDAAGRTQMHQEWSTWYLSFSKLIILMYSDRSSIEAVSFSKAPLLYQSQQMWQWNSIWKDWEARHEDSSLLALTQRHSSHEVEPPVRQVPWRKELGSRERQKGSGRNRSLCL